MTRDELIIEMLRRRNAHAPVVVAWEVGHPHGLRVVAGTRPVLQVRAHDPHIQLIIDPPLMPPAEQIIAAMRALHDSSRVYGPHNVGDQPYVQTLTAPHRMMLAEHWDRFEMQLARSLGIAVADLR